MAEQQPSRQVQRRYPPELRERAVRLVHETAAEQGEQHGAVGRVARQLGIGPESLRHWVRQAEVDQGERPGLSTAERTHLKELEREVRELRRANEILKSAADSRECASSTLMNMINRSSSALSQVPPCSLVTVPSAR